MSFRRFATIATLGLAGIAAAVGIGLLANTISGESVGLGAEPLSAGEALAPATTTTDDREREDRQRRNRNRNRGGNDDDPQTTTSPTLTDELAPPTTTPDDDSRGSGSSGSGGDSSGSGSGEDSSGQGRGRGRGRGGDDPDERTTTEGARAPVMDSPVDVRPETQADFDAIREVHARAFAPSDVEPKLVDQLRADGASSRTSAWWRQTRPARSSATSPTAAPPSTRGTRSSCSPRWPCSPSTSGAGSASS